MKYYDDRQIINLASKLGHKVPYVRITYTEETELLTTIKEENVGTFCFPKKINVEKKTHDVCFSFYRDKMDNWAEDKKGLSAYSIKLFEDLQSYAKEHGIDAIWYRDEGKDNYGDYRYSYYHFLPALVVFTIAKIAEKNLNKEFLFTEAKGTDYTGHEFYWHYDEEKPLSGRLDFFTKKGEDVQDFVNEFNKVFEESPYYNMFTVSIETKLTQPRKLKKEPEISVEEKTKIAKATLKSIIESTNEDVLNFLKKENLMDKFKESFINDFVNSKPNTVVLTGSVMLGDADGWEDVEETLSITEFNYIKEWLEAYKKKFPDQNEGTALYEVGNEHLSGFWVYRDVCNLFNKFTSRTLNGPHVSGSLLVSIDKNAEPWVNELEASVDLPFEDLEFEYPESIIDALLPYATYWNIHDRKDEFLIELNDIS